MGTPRKKFEIGDKYGDLTLIEDKGQYVESSGHTRRIFIVKCDKGHEFEKIFFKTTGIDVRCLHCGNIGRRKFKAGETLGVITILDRTKRFRADGIKYDYLYKCQCVCGEISFKGTENLKRWEFKACKCKSKVKSYGEIPGYYFIKVKHGAERRNMEFSITIKQMNDLFIQQNKKCALSGLDLKFEPKSTQRKSKNTTASLDRIDSKIGYKIDNIQWVHKDINMMKQDHIDEDFIKYCKIVAEYNKD